MGAMERVRFDAAVAANAEDASIWRWFSVLLEERRIRWRYMFDNWVVNVDRAHVATEQNFDDAIRAAKLAAEQLGLGAADAHLSGGKWRGAAETGSRRQHAGRSNRGKSERRKLAKGVGF